MSEYTPTEARARDLYSWAYAWRTEDAEGETDLSELRASQRAEFDRMIAQVKAEAQVEALREFAEEWDREWENGRVLTLHAGMAARARSNRIAREAGIETGEKSDG